MFLPISEAAKDRELLLSLLLPLSRLNTQDNNLLSSSHPITSDTIPHIDGHLVPISVHQWNRFPAPMIRF